MMQWVQKHWLTIAGWCVGVSILVTFVLLVLLPFQVLKAETNTALGELLLVIVLGFGEVFVLIELRHADKRHKHDTWVRAMDMWADPQFLVSRIAVHNLVKRTNTEWSDVDHEAAKETCRRMDYFAQVMAAADESAVLEEYGHSAAKLWRALRATVDTERIDTGSHTKWRSFEKLGAEALRQQVAAGRLPQSAIDEYQGTFVNPPTKGSL